MRILLIVILSVFTINLVSADCSGNGLWAFPNTKTIKQNSIIVLTGYYRSQNIVTSLNKKYPIYLESEGHKVKLNVKSIYKGMFELTQAVLEPEEELISGRTYILIIDRLGKFKSSLLTKWNSELGKNEPIRWKVESGIDIQKPQLLGQPELVDNRMYLYGCGPAIYADFKIKAKDESDLLIKTELVDLESGKSNIYLLSFSKTDTLSVGHGMCLGAFDFKENGKYKIRFSLMDVCGNKNDEWTTWIEFDSPYERCKNGDKTGLWK